MVRSRLLHRYEVQVSDLKDLTLKDLYAVYRHVTQHREHAILLKDQMAQENAEWLLAEVKKEIKGRQ
jgi:hypothetical protein